MKTKLFLIILLLISVVSCSSKKEEPALIEKGLAPFFYESRVGNLEGTVFYELRDAEVADDIMFIGGIVTKDHEMFNMFYESNYKSVDVAPLQRDIRVVFKNFHQSKELFVVVFNKYPNDFDIVVNFGGSARGILHIYLSKTKKEITNDFNNNTYSLPINRYSICSNLGIYGSLH